MNVLITSSNYTTLLYFLMNEPDDIKRSAFFFISGSKCPEQERERIISFLPKSYFIIEPSLSISIKGNAMARRIYTLLQLVYRRSIPYILRRISKNFRWPFLKTANIFAYHYNITTSAAASLIGGRDYVSIEDGLGMYTNFENSLHARLMNFLTKPFGAEGLALSKHVSKIIFTGLAEIPECYRNKNIEIISIPKLWENSGSVKRAFITKFFGLEASDIDTLKQRDVILMDQPLSDDWLITREEQIELVRKILEHYGASRVLLKRHYRNTIDYRAIFPDLMTWDKPTPMELLTLCGVHFREAVTLNSTAVLTLPEDVNIVWLGRDLSNPLLDHLSSFSRKMLEDFCSSLPLPQRIRDNPIT